MISTSPQSTSRGTASTGDVPVALDPDHGHVLLDALNALRRACDTPPHGIAPWEEYDGANPAEDPKASREGYLRLIDALHSFGGALVEENATEVAAHMRDWTSSSH